SLIAARRIPKGTQIERDMIVIKRPGYGIRPKLIDLVIGRVAKMDIDEDTVLTWEMLGGPRSSRFARRDRPTVRRCGAGGTTRPRGTPPSSRPRFSSTSIPNGSVRASLLSENDGSTSSLETAWMPEWYGSTSGKERRA